MEAIKVCGGVGTVSSGKMTLYDGIDSTFRSFKLRPRNKKCPVCGDSENVTIKSPQDSLGTKQQGSCASCLVVPCIEPHWEISCAEVASTGAPRVVLLPGDEEPLSEGTNSSVILDVRSETQFVMCHLSNPNPNPNPNPNWRSETQFAMCHLSGSVNIPYKHIVDGSAEKTLQTLLTGTGNEEGDFRCDVICRRGQDSTATTALLRQQGFTSVYNIKGGLNAWSAEVDATLPMY